MREIKFRAWNGKKILPVEELRLGTFQGADLRTNRQHVESWGLDKIKLMQFTGLKDKNGKEIYEGDIVHCYMGKFCEVTNKIFFFEGAFILYDLGQLHVGVANHSEVIGNIYENPELVK